MAADKGVARIALFLSCFLFISALGLLLFQNPVQAEVPSDNPHSPVLQTEAEGDFFVTAPICGQCHSGITDSAGTDISFDVAWRSSVMANASNDPYWLASVRRETVANPAELTPIIQDICATCHMPMARFTANMNGSPSLVLDAGGYADPANDLHAFAAEGVSCTVCHQIKDDNFGEPESFDGGYLIDDQTPAGERVLYGTYEISRGSIRRMSLSSGYDVVQSDHLAASELCATCHNLTTPYLDENDEIAGTIPAEQQLQRRTKLRRLSHAAGEGRSHDGG